MIVQKKSFSLETFHFERAKKEIPVTIGYETYGRLNDAGDNAILLCHYFTGTSHAAGKYDESDPLPGWWDTLIGPGKAIDTDRFFVVCADAPSNINHHNPRVITTGPASINPATGREYGTDFPIFTLKDVVRLQKRLIESLGIQKLYMVGGPSMGGLQGFMWGRHFPGLVDRILAVCATPMIRPFGIMVPNQLGIDAIRLDPNWRGGHYYGQEPPRAGLLLAFKILLVATRTDLWAERSFGRQYADPLFTDYEDPFISLDGKFLVEKEIENIVLGRMQFFDANAYLYIAKANALFDLRENGETLGEALARIRAETLMIIDDSDIMFTRDQAEEGRRSIPRCHCFYYNSENGHLSAIYDMTYFEGALRDFLKQ
jgi:homoserine O-acetyltransferase/O-succinyltransferase